MKNLLNFAEQFLGQKAEIKPLAGAGSNRKYFRVFCGESTYVGVIGENVDENEAFIYLAEHLGRIGKRVPKVLAVSDDRLMYLQTDLGDISLFDLLVKNDPTTEKVILQVVEDLAKIEVEGVKDVDPCRFFGIQRMDKRSVLWDLNYFKYSFLKCADISVDESLLEDAFDNMADYLCSLDGSYLLYRDFQSRNMMINNDYPYYIDFQGARLGPLGYDIVSFLYQAKANFSPELKQRYLALYYEALKKYGVNTDKVAESINTFILFRTLQVLGAYGFRGFFEKKAHFLQSIAPALKNLGEIVEHDFPFECEYLKRVCRELASRITKYECDLKESKLTVTVSSFSFLKGGVPTDFSGNGGGFAFDCRAIYNPGREEALKTLTGMDREVSELLDANEDMQDYLVHAFALIDKSVKKFLERDFSHLMVGFGCSGGQHRSVYSAERCAKHLKAKFPQVRVVINHREQNVKKIFE